MSKESEAKDEALMDASSALIGGDPGTELASNRTAMSFERSEMASDRTLMASIRTALSLIGFGFTIYQFFNSIEDQFGAHRSLGVQAGRLGIALIGIGIVLLLLSIRTHWRTITSLRARRTRLYELHLVRALPQFHISTISLIAVLLLGIGILAILSIGLGVGPF